ncbi:microcystin-dependent protein [Bacillus oleivorans]|uniref:Microcystin-dependent protein n=1 Tax=Bacillus oleivorans TaxID=1448271 RepID=A0A285CI42_9BACI|nr:tail fiber protein [Bacillus oleivorans]SNX67015.1 microcystin-dependent protein [Bacillus oleivorans]
MDAYIGEIRMFGGNFAPVGWAFCNGQEISISDNEALFSLIGTTYGGDGTITFALPDLRGRLPVHQGVSSSGKQYDLGEMAGTETVSLSVSQLPKHSHMVSADSQEGTIESPANATWATNMKQYAKPDDTSMITLNPDSISYVGESGSHNNMMPFQALSFIICLEGLFPPRD